MSEPEAKKRKRGSGARPKNAPLMQMTANNIGSAINEDYYVFVSNSLECIKQAYQKKGSMLTLWH